MAASQMRMVVSKDAVTTSCGIDGFADPGPTSHSQSVNQSVSESVMHLPIGNRPCDLRERRVNKGKSNIVPIQPSNQV